MTRNKVFLILQSALYALTAGWLAFAAMDMYFKGAAIQASGELFYYIYTREKVAERLMPMLPLIFGTVGMTVAGWILGVRDGGANRPVPVADMSCASAVSQDGGRGMLILRAAVLALAVALIAAGIQNGGLEDVMTKANAICMECVGLG